MLITNNITGETVNVEDVVTSIQPLTVEQQKQETLAELEQLDGQISRVEEDIIVKIGLALYPANQAVVDRKNELREMLNTL